MQYAEVYVDQRLAKSKKLTYKIPAAMLASVKSGSLVDVPLRGRVVRGIIVNFIARHHSKTEPVSILRLRSTGAVVTPEHIQLYQDIAVATLSSIEDVLFYFLPPAKAHVPVDIDSQSAGKPGKIRYVAGTLLERFGRYKTLLEEFKGSVVFMFPAIGTLYSFKQFLGLPGIVAITGQDTPKQRWLAWQTVHAQKEIIITTRVGIGYLPIRPAILVIDEPTHPGYKEDRRPKYCVEELLTLQTKRGSNIVIGTTQPSLLHMYLYKTDLVAKLPPVQLVSTPKYLAQTLAHKIGDHESVLIAIPQKGDWKVLVCKECQTTLRCPVCNRALGQVDNDRLYCHHCKTTRIGFPACQTCQSYSYQGYSIGTNALEKELNKELPDRTIIRLDKTNRPNTFKSTNNSIIIATQTLLDRPVLKFDRVFCLGFDYLLDIPYEQQEEKVLLTLNKFIMLGKKAEIITSRPEHRVYHGIASNTVARLMAVLLDERGTHLPPSARIVTITSLKKIDDSILSSLQKFSEIPIAQTVSKKTYKVRLSVSRKRWLAFYELTQTLPRDFRIDPDPRD